ncbi:MAG: glycoside hydrolase family 5 protein, partial [Kiritimatiellaeota bacterium]|nr:glycoside hydrolase family 5 protein [Kiritimatiellota bacterium]
PFVVWEAEAGALKARMEKFLGICHRNGVRVMLALFDDCCFGDQANPVFGRLREMIPGWYANAWTPSPGHDIARDAAQWPRLEPYVKDIVGTFRGDPRVWVWDVYNEPANGLSVGDQIMPVGDVSLPLVERVIAWAREAGPSQPLTLGAWNDNPALNAIARAHSDVTSFHSYTPRDRLREIIAGLKVHGRPVICTEWLHRNGGSTVDGCLPVFLAEGVGALHWGLVNGKTQTHLGWGHLPGQPVNPVWQHDLFHGGHTPYDPAEIRLFQQNTPRPWRATGHGLSSP